MLHPFQFIKQCQFSVMRLWTTAFNYSAILNPPNAITLCYILPHAFTALSAFAHTNVLSLWPVD